MQIKRGRRLAVDHRALKRVTERRYFITPRRHDQDGGGGSKFISAGDLRERFSQVDNIPETSSKMTVLAEH